MRVIQEKGLSRILTHIEAHDTGSITAYRYQFSKRENQQRNKSLQAKLASLGYGITSVRGTYIEDYGTPEAKEVGEHTFFVVDLTNRGRLRDDLIRLGQEFDQDSILFIPKGGVASELIGTNETGYPGLGNSLKLPVLKFGDDGNEFLTRVAGRPFYFTESILSEVYCGNAMGRYAATITAKKHWTEL